MKSLFVISFLVLGARAESSVTTCYTEQNLTGDYHSFVNYAPVLFYFDLDDVIDSVQQTGMWIYYENNDYNLSPGYVYFVHGIDISVNFPAEYCDITSSLRYAGSYDILNADTITLYEGDSFTSREYFTKEDTPDFGLMTFTISSLIITGSSPWTVYSNVGYSGQSACVYADTDHDVGSNGEVFDLGIYPNMASLNFTDNSIYSVRKGCWSERNIKAPELNVDGRQKNGAWGRLV